MDKAPISFLTARLEATQESLRQAVASIDRLTAERARDRVGWHDRANQSVLLQNELSSAKASLATMTEFRNGALKALNSAFARTDELEGEIDALAKENEELKRRPALPEDWADMAELGRFVARLFRRGHLVASLDERRVFPGLKVSPDSSWGASHLNPQSRLARIIAGLTK